KDFQCKAMPTGLPGSRQVVEPRFKVFMHSQGCHVGNKLCWRGCADLVRNNIERFLLLRQTQHGFHEVMTTGAVYPTGTKDQMIRAAFLYCLITGQFALAIYRKWPGWAVFRPGGVACS